MEYKGYSASILFDGDAEVLHGTVLHIRDTVTFEAESVADLKREFHASVDDYLAFCADRGEEPDRPFSGRFVLRLDPEVHRAVATLAELRGVSLNTWVTEAIQHRMGASTERTARRWVRAT